MLPVQEWFEVTAGGQDDRQSKVGRQFLAEDDGIERIGGPVAAGHHEAYGDLTPLLLPFDLVDREPSLALIQPQVLRRVAHVIRVIGDSIERQRAWRPILIRSIGSGPPRRMSVTALLDRLDDLGFFSSRSR